MTSPDLTPPAASPPVTNVNQTVDAEALSKEIASYTQFAESVLPSPSWLQTALEERQGELKDAYLSLQDELSTLQDEEQVLFKALENIKRELDQYTVPDH